MKTAALSLVVQNITQTASMQTIMPIQTYRLQMSRATAHVHHPGASQQSQLLSPSAIWQESPIPEKSQAAMLNQHTIHVCLQKLRVRSIEMFLCQAGERLFVCNQLLPQVSKRSCTGTISQNNVFLAYAFAQFTEIAKKMQAEHLSLVSLGSSQCTWHHSNKLHATLSPHI